MRTTLSKRNETWQLRIDNGRDPVTGKRLQKTVSTGCTRKKDAEEFQKKYLDDMKKNNGEIPSELTLRDLFKRWLESMETRVRPSTLATYCWAADKHILPHLGNVPLKELTPLHVEDLLGRLRKQKLATSAAKGKNKAAKRVGEATETGLKTTEKKSAKTMSPTSIRYVYNVLNAALTRAVRWRLIPVNPVQAVDPPRKARFEATALDDGQLVSLMATAADTPLHLPIVLAVTCGLRRGEVCGLRWCDVDLDNAVAYVRHTLDWIDGKLDLHPVKTARSERSVKLGKITVDVLKKEKVRQAADKLRSGDLYQNSGYCWAWDDGRPYDPDYLYKKFQKLLQEAKLPVIRFHDLRHSHATTLLANGVPVKIISERLGHTSVSFTQDIYSHVLPNMQQQAADMVDRLFTKDNEKPQSEAP